MAQSRYTGRSCGAGHRTHAYLQEVHARPRNPSREGLQLYTAVIAVCGQLIRHRVVPCPLQIIPHEPTFMDRRVLENVERRTRILRMMRPRASALRSYRLYSWFWLRCASDIASPSVIPLRNPPLRLNLMTVDRMASYPIPACRLMRESDRVIREARRCIPYGALWRRSA